MSSGHKGHEPYSAHASPTIGGRELLVAGGLSLVTAAARPDHAEGDGKVQPERKLPDH